MKIKINDKTLACLWCWLWRTNKHFFSCKSRFLETISTEQWG